MFEQSMVETRGASKPWMLLAMTGQCVAAGLVLMVPLMHPEVLNAPRMFMNIVYRTPDPTPIDIKVQASSSAPRSGGPSIPTARPRVFQAPNHIPSNVAEIIDTPSAQLEAAFTRGGTGQGVPGPGVSFSVGDGIPNTAPPAPVVKPVAKSEPPAPVPPLRQGGKVQEALMIHRVIPAYPPLAKAARIQGQVHLEGIIARDGTIQQLRVMSGHPLLVQAALDAVRQWRYKPTHLNGEPVEVIAPIDVNFILSN